MYAKQLPSVLVMCDVLICSGDMKYMQQNLCVRYLEIIRKIG